MAWLIYGDNVFEMQLSNGEAIAFYDGQVHNHNNMKHGIWHYRLRAFETLQKGESVS